MDTRTSSNTADTLTSTRRVKAAHSVGAVANKVGVVKTEASCPPAPQLPRSAAPHQIQVEGRQGAPAAASHCHTFPLPLSLPLSLPLDLARGGNPRRRSSALRAYPPPPPLPSRLHLQQRFAETQVSFAETQVSASEVPTLTQIKSQKSVP